MGRLLLVSNRLPVAVRADVHGVRVARSDGGLAAGLRGPHERGDGLWFGWPGETGRMDRRQRDALDLQLKDLRLVPVHLATEDVHRYYDGFSNAVLWPLFHYVLDRIPLDAQGWDAYVRVNERFAEAVAAAWRPGDRVWVHDYHLALVPALLRRRCPDARIGFFLHIPFPAAEVFRTLPWRRPILEGLLGADLVGFHTATYRRHFVSALRIVPSLEAGEDAVEVDGRRVSLGVFPMGVDARALAALAEAPETLAEADRHRGDGVRVVLGIDRLDYTKGIPRRLLAFERLLEREPAARGKVRLVQIAVPSRERVDAYRDIRRQVEELVGRINGLYTHDGRVPVHYVYRSLDERQVAALYRAADVMLVTPLRDGMNLVAKEFVATRTDGDGVLVLSELAGAAEELTAALTVNPYDIDGVARGLARALAMPEAERRARMEVLRRQVVERPVGRWVDGFVDALTTSEPPSEGPVDLGSPFRREAWLSVVRETQRRVLFLDYDGTLVPFAPRAEGAVPDPDLLALLGRLAADGRNEVHLVSGRPREDLEGWFGALPVHLHAEHGRWSKLQGDGAWSRRGEAGDATWMGVVRPTLAGWCARVPGAHLEEKSTTLAFHYRAAGLPAPPADLLAELEELSTWLPLDVLRGNRVVEVRTRGMSKARVVQDVRDRLRVPVLPVALGDDRTDGVLFRALPGHAWTVQVGDGPLPARYRVRDPSAARALLAGLVEPRAAR